jgi:hypothetical protein
MTESRWTILIHNGHPYKRYRQHWTSTTGEKGYSLGPLLRLAGRELWDWEQQQRDKLVAEAEAIRAAHAQAEHDEIEQRRKT